MKNLFINSSINMIKRYNDFNDIKIEEIKYGLLSLYLTFSKIFVILILSVLLHITKEVIIFLFIYNIIRMPSFGLHATKSWICLLSSSIIFIGCPLICSLLSFSITTRYIVGCICIFLLYMHSPADTYKRPIVNKRRRKVYKLLSTLVGTMFVIISISIKNNFLANAFIISLIVQCCMISPIVYKLFNLPYNNYKNYVPKLN